MRKLTGKAKHAAQRRYLATARGQARQRAAEAAYRERKRARLRETVDIDTKELSC
jgi:hypothetical protein